MAPQRTPYNAKGQKWCYGCLRFLLPTEFNRSKKGWDGLRTRCKGCLQRYRQDPAEKARMKRYIRDWKLQYKFGITLDEFHRRIEQQLGCCAICRRRFGSGYQKACVDHCHKTRRIRGIICKRCNLGLGQLGDTYESLQRVLNYLKPSSDPDDPS